MIGRRGRVFSTRFQASLERAPRIVDVLIHRTRTGAVRRSAGHPGGAPMKGGGAVYRFLRFTAQKEPAPTASFLAGVLLAIAARYLGLTDEDLAILGEPASSSEIATSAPIRPIAIGTP